MTEEEIKSKEERLRRLIDGVADCAGRTSGHAILKRYATVSMEADYLECLAKSIRTLANELGAHPLPEVETTPEVVDDLADIPAPF